MKNKLLIALFTIVQLATFNSFAQDKVTSIKGLENKEIVVDNDFAGASFTLIKENEGFYIVRKIFGSGVPVARTIKYKPVFESEGQINFSEPIENSKEENKEIESFVLKLVNDKPELYRNGKSLKIRKIRTLPNVKRN
jgi:hypothetical protein